MAGGRSDGVRRRVRPHLPVLLPAWGGTSLAWRRARRRRTSQADRKHDRHHKRPLCIPRHLNRQCSSFRSPRQPCGWVTPVVVIQEDRETLPPALLLVPLETQTHAMMHAHNRPLAPRRPCTPRAARHPREHPHPPSRRRRGAATEALRQHTTPRGAPTRRNNARAPKRAAQALTANSARLPNRLGSRI